MKKVKKKLKTYSAFTLIEILIATAILGIILLIIAVIWQQTTTFYETNYLQNLATNKANDASETISKSLRRAVTGENDAPALEKADDYEIIFYSNVDQDSAIEKVRYFIENQILKQGIIEPGADSDYSGTENITEITKHLLNQDLSYPMFIYYDENIIPLIPPVDPGDAKLIHLKLLLDVDLEKLPDAYEVNTKVKLRNL